MPKVIDTRKQRAAKLLERIERGPSFNPTTGEPLTEFPFSACGF